MVALSSDASLRLRASEHVRNNAEGLTIERSVKMIMERLATLSSLSA